MSENKKIAKSAGIVSFGILLSRITGFVRDFVIAWAFGASASADAFFVALRIPNLLRRLFAEGSLTVAFIPIFTEYLNKDGKDSAYTMARSSIYFLSIILVFITIIGILLSEPIVKCMAPGFISNPEKLSLTITMTKIMFPYVFFICIVAIFMGILNVLGHFFAPAFSTVLLNGSIIISALFLSSHLEKKVLALAIGVLIGGFLQFLFQIPFLIKKGFSLIKKAPLLHPAVVRIIKLMLPAIVGSAAYQINIIISTIMTSTLQEGSVSYLYYADRIVEFPLALFAISTSTAILPSFSKQYINNNIDGLKDTFANAMNFILFITIPAMLGLIVLSTPVVELLFKRGAFDSNALQMTSSALLCYLLGLWAFSCIRIPISVFYSMQDTKTPVKTSIISIIFNIIASLILMQFFKHNGLALATSLASILNLYLLLRALKKKIGELPSKKIINSLMKTIISSLIMAGVVFYFKNILYETNLNVMKLLIVVFSCIMAGIISFTLSAYLFKSEEFNSIFKMVKKWKK